MLRPVLFILARCNKIRTFPPFSLSLSVSRKWARRPRRSGWFAAAAVVPAVDGGCCGHPSARDAGTTASFRASRVTSDCAGGVSVSVLTASWSSRGSESWRHRWLYAGLFIPHLHSFIYVIITQYHELSCNIIYNCRFADTSGRAVWGEGLRLIAYWGCGFEFRRGHECLSVVSVVCVVR